MKTAKLLVKDRNDARFEACEEKVYSLLKKNERLVLDQLARSNKPMKAYEILEPLHDQGIRAPMTVYRALENLVRLKLVKRISSLNAYFFLGFEKRDYYPAFIICRDCLRTRTVEVDSSQIKLLFQTQTVNENDTTIELMVECDGGC